MVLAHVLAEDRRPPDELWSGTLASSRLLAYEVWSRVNARKLGGSHGAIVEEVLGRILFVEMAPPVLARALEPLPVAVRTLDALHLATMDFLRRQGLAVHLASYDQRLLDAAVDLGFAVAPAG